MKKRIAWAMVGLAAAGLVAQPLRPAVVVGGSMSPTYASGEWVVTEPVDRPLRRGDVVIADTPSGTVIKRVALLGGDRRVQFRSGRVWVDTTLLDGPWSARGRRSLRAVPVPLDEVFLLGDNIQSSVDSRSYGSIPLSQVRRLVVEPRSPDSRAGVEGALAQRWIDRGSRTLGWTL